MPLVRYSSLIGALLVLLTGAASAAEPVRVMTFNIRYGTAPDGDNAWPHRRDMVVKVIRDFDPDVLGLQEALREQLDELAAALPHYTIAGVGREPDGTGEYSAVLYRRSRFDLADAGTFWLSDTPEAPGSRSWGNNLPRISTWVRLLDRNNGSRFVVFNTHWDHESQPARYNSGCLLAERIGERTEAGEPVIVMGDFNAGEDNPAITALCKQGELLRDTFRVVHPEEKDVGTFNGFGLQFMARKIDGIWVNDSWSVGEAEIVRTREGERFPSDHFPVTATVSLKAAK